MEPKQHTIEYSIREATDFAPHGSLRAHCRDCDEYVDSNPLSDHRTVTSEEMRRELVREKAKLIAIFAERPCHPDRRGPIIIGG